MSDFFLNNPKLTLKTLKELRQEWINVPNKKIIEIMILELQYLELQKFILKELQSTDSGEITKLYNEGGGIPSLRYALPLFSGIRAASVKSMLLIYSSVTEAVLYAHAEARNYRLPEAKKRTFGTIINAWERSGDHQKEPIEEIWNEVKKIKNFRDYIHLYKAEKKGKDFYQVILSVEAKYVILSEKVLGILKRVCS